MKYDLTVIVPVYNTEQYLERCLNSIVNQKNREYVKLRVICVNDGSPDNSLAILESYSQQYECIEVFSKENGGIADARNYGLDLVEDSLYVTYLDSDDFWAEGFLAYFSQSLSKQSDMIFFDIILSDYNGQAIKTLKVNRDTDVQNINRFIVLKHAPWTRICKTSLYDHVRFPKGKLYEDLAVLPYLTSQAKQIEYIQVPLYHYIVNTPGSIMNTSSKKIFDIYPALEYLFELFGEQFEMYKEEIHYLALEHLGIGHTYRLLKYPKTTKQDFKDIVLFMEKYFGKQWHKNKYMKKGVHKNNINSALSGLMPLILKILHLKWFNVFQLLKKGKD
ncbi:MULTISPECIES: glycosyltransferase family 2 protein [unclassified Granulicatella]|uniref:glycosyltransferase family 2 protein n=1 Tax=unclassified Granulicatella TaxID=2630493 RepID=UPI001073FBF2|nr:MULTISPECIES: glycosyltransferase family 2 protein [unclassified Granulicatella]MBF0780250.1 glycosyltransferase family 2 protein [Granulicatella sp. 19428wC4_WM01]TFU95631.1 glycosyltransferase family 2 protein [Granulicatella sp. WM01]